MRLFLALDPPLADKRRLASLGEDLRALGVRGSFTRAENFHLTLRFLGEADRRGAELLREMLAGVQVLPFTLCFTRAGRFQRRDGDILWVGAELDGALADVHGKLTRALAELGHPPEARPFTPHLTIARRAQVPRALDWRAALERGLPLEAPVDGVRLLRTEFVPGGVRYHQLARSGGQSPQ